MVLTATPARRVSPAASARLRRLGPPVVFLAALVPLALIVGDALGDRLGANPIEEIEKRTGTWTLRFLALTLAITPVRRLAGWSWLAPYRRMLGLFTFFYACVHLSAYAGLDMYFDAGDIVEDVAKHLYITVGMASFLLLVPLALTSTKGWMRRLGGARWKRLHRATYAAAVGGTVHYLWAVKKDTLLPLVYLAIFVALLGVRVWWTVAARRERASLARPGAGGRDRTEPLLLDA